MELINELAKKHNLYVIEDTAQALGANYTFSDGSKKKAGTIGTIGCTSFFPSKNLGCFGDGGAIFTNDDELAKKIRITANHGQSKQYIHDSIGVNSRLDSIQAAVLRVKLKELDNYASARNFAANHYDTAFANNDKIKTPERVSFSNHVFHQYTIQLNGVDRTALKEYLASKGVPAMVYYPIPLHLQEAYKDPRYSKGDFPVTEKLCETVISFPMHTELDEDTLQFISSSVLEFVNK
jgi:dTDP-4-amino-4,6-dideoxygalactose transaminase